MYTVMFFVNNEPTVVTIDDYFPTINGKSAFVSVDADPRDGVKQIWPLILEKAYAKLFNGYTKIEEGTVEEALSDIGNGFPMKIELTDPKVKA
jgi:hypothetical protein